MPPERAPTRQLASVVSDLACPPSPTRFATTASLPTAPSTRPSLRSAAATGAPSRTCRRSSPTRRRCSRSGPRAGCATAATRPATTATAAAGWPFFGQFIAHDITADRSPIGPHADATTIANFRSPRANLECLYGAGPVGAPFLYDARDPAKLLRGDGDVPRNAQGTALLGDPRNDVHVFISQLHHAPDRRAQPARRPPARGRRRPGRVLRRGPARGDVALPVGDRRGLPGRARRPRPRRGGQGPRAAPLPPRGHADHPLRVRRRRLPLRPRPDPPPLPPAGGRRRVRGLPRPRRLSPGGARAPDRLAAALRPRGPAGQAHGRPSGRLAHRAPARDHAATSTSRPITRSRHATCSAAPPSACPPARRWHARSVPSRSRASEAGLGAFGWDGGDAAVALRAARGRRARRRRAPRRGRRTARGRGAARPARRRPRVLPRAGPRLGADAPGGRASASARSTCWSAPP